MKTDYNSKSIELPILNGILYSDGSVDYYCIYEDEKNKRYLEKCSEPQDDLFNTSIIIVDEEEFDDIDLRVSVGEGSFGGDGFILAETVSTDKMLWLISFEYSNPFISLKRNGNRLFVENNLYEIWEIDIKDMIKPKLSIIKQSEF